MSRCSTPALTYEGPPLEKGGTSINGAIKTVVALLQPYIKPGMRVLDYGAGKHARFADHFRQQGIQVYAYDPYNANGSEGWALGSVSNETPLCVFDLAFSVYVLNVVPERVEDEVIQQMSVLSSRCIHVTRGNDITADAGKAVRKGTGKTYRWFHKVFGPLHPTALDELREGSVCQGTLREFAHFGFATERGFQRIPVLEAKGFELVSRSPKLYVG